MSRFLARSWLLGFGFFGACAPKVARIPGPLDHLGRPPLAISAPATHASPSRLDAFETEVTEAARHYLDVAPKGFRDDCSGFVMAVFARAGLPIDGSTASLYDWARENGLLNHHKVPKPGDIAFFDDTYDRNDNGRLDDDLSHIAIVIQVDPDGTILLAHAGTSHGRTTMHMNLEEADLHEDATGKVVNDWLRAHRDSDPKQTEYLSGELWRAFATLTPGVKPAGTPDVAATP